MNILIVSQYFWPEFFLVNELATELQKKGNKVTVLTGLPNYPQGELFQGYRFWQGPWTEHYQGVEIKRVPLLPRKKGFFWLAINYFSFVFFGIIPGLFRSPKNIDVIFCFGLSPITACIPAIFIKWLRRAPLVFWVQDLWPESVAAVKASGSSRVLNLIGALARWIYSHCDLILMQSQAFQASIQRWGGTADQLIYVPNWFKAVDKLISTPNWLQNTRPGFKVIFAGNIGQAQDMDSILAAAEILKDQTQIQWMIVGDGSAKAFVDAEIINRNLQATVQTFGRRPVEDMPGLFAAGDLMLVTLTDEYIFSLTIPSKVQAYMASGKPILAALNGEGARIVEEAQAGLSCPSESPQLLADRVLQFSQMSPIQLKEMGERGRDYFHKNFERSLVIDKIETICQSVVKKSL